MSTNEPKRVSDLTARIRLALGLAIACVLCAVSAAPASAAFSIEEIGGAFNNPDGSTNFQAGAHPDYTTRVVFSRVVNSEGKLVVDRNTRNARVDLPSGVVGNAAAMPQCTAVQLRGAGGLAHAECPAETQIGNVDLDLAAGSGTIHNNKPVYNMVPPRGSAAQFAFNEGGVIVTVNARVVSSPDYHVVTEVVDASQGESIPGTTFHFWGVPADPVHDAERYAVIAPVGGGFGFFGPPSISTAPVLPFMTAPTACGTQLTTRVEGTSWQEPNTPVSGSFDTDLEGNPMVFEGCDQLDFSPEIEARPTTNVADSPSGLDVKIHVPQNDDPDGLGEAQLKDSMVNFPAGMTLNPAAAQGLEACSPAQIGLTSPVGQADAKFNDAPATCPEAAKLGTTQIDTPLLADPLRGAVYQATQDQNPFGSLVAIYVIAESPKSGVRLKLAGHPILDQSTGQMKVAFDNNPQLPFDDFRLNFFTGPRAVLKTPQSCGNFTTTSTMVPWTSPEGAAATPSDTFAITKGANNTACLKADSEAPNKPAFSAGTTDPTAGAYSPFVLKLAREDGSAPIKAIDATLPKGLLGKLVGISYCPDSALAVAATKPGKSEQASPSCPASSRVGSVTVGAGAGSNPLYTSGIAYLAGPYKGAPLSLAVITPAVAGPFDLGTVVIRNALQVDPESAQIRAVSDPIPTILQGIPLELRSITLSMDRPDFTLNPTSCNPTSIFAGVTSVFNQTAALSNPFQVGGCNALGFKPQLAIDLKGATKRAQYPALKATLKARPGDANIAKAVVSLPHSEFLAQNHIKTICTRVQFAANTCPPGSIYGKATVWSPLLDKPLQGPVYLRSSSHDLPDLVVDLNGQIRVTLAGRIDSIKGGIRNSFEVVPDAPVSKFVLEMAGGKKGLLENSRNLCNSVNKADVQLDGQNGKTADSTPVVTNDCKVKKKHKRKSPSKGSRR